MIYLNSQDQWQSQSWASLLPLLLLCGCHQDMTGLAWERAARSLLEDEVPWRPEPGPLSEETTGIGELSQFHDTTYLAHSWLQTCEGALLRHAQISRTIITILQETISHCCFDLWSFWGGLWYNMIVAIVHWYTIQNCQHTKPWHWYWLAKKNLETQHHINTIW